MPKCLIISSPYYKDIESALRESATAELDAQDIEHEIISVPGALEIPLALKLGIESGKYDLYIALGCVIRGETAHYDVVVNESARGLSTLGLAHNAPIGNAILTCDTMEQAKARTDKGKDAAQAAISLYKIKEQLV